MKSVRLLQKYASSKLEDVTNAYENAIFSKWPKKRYAIGPDCCYFVIPMSYLPSLLQDKIITLFHKKYIN